MQRLGKCLGLVAALACCPGLLKAAEPRSWSLFDRKPASAARQKTSAPARTAAPLPFEQSRLGPYAQAPQAQPAAPAPDASAGTVAPAPSYAAGPGGVQPVRYDMPHFPAYSWPSYAAYPNYAALTYPTQYSPTAWPYIGPFYPYPQVPLGWRKVKLEWDDGWWFLSFDRGKHSCCR